MLRHLMFAFALMSSLAVWAVEDTRDTYSYRGECPENGVTYERNRTSDSDNFIRCQCTSYVAHKLNELWNGTNPRFTNQYYGFDRWGNAVNWYNRARSDRAEIGVTGARDNFEWDERQYNAVFHGDVAYWDTPVETGHVAFVESATRGPNNRGVGCVTVSEYNGTTATRYNFNERTLCRNADGTFPAGFPRYFLHIDQDRTYCRDNPTIDTCRTLMNRTVASTGSKYIGGLGGGSDPFNLKLNHFWTRDIATGLDIDSDTGSVRTGQAIAVRMQIKAKDGDTHDHMRDGKDTIELDFYAREDLGEWYFLKREYIQATNLPNDATHTEHVDYVVPVGVTEVSFKVKVDAEDEASESNEGDNWSPIITLPVNNNPTYDLTVISVSLTTTQPVPVGGLMGARMGIRNLGNATPPMAGKACYEIQGPSTNNLWQTIADDTLDEGTLVPGFDWWEEIISLVRAPTVPGGYTLRATANCTGTIPETDMTNNSLAIPFDVVPPRPDFIVRAVGPAGGSASIKAGSRFYPAMYVKNVGTAASPSAIRSAYWFMGPGTGNAWVYITDDGTEASRLCVGCEEREQYDGGMKISVRGTYYFRGCADYEGVVTESNEANNCTVSSPITVY